MDPDSALDRGRTKYEEVYPRKASANPSEFERIMYEDLFGGVYQRPGLSQRDRRLMIIGVAAAHGIDSILNLQLSAGVAKGDLTDADLDEIAIFLTQYVGYPLGTRVRAAVAEARKG